MPNQSWWDENPDVWAPPPPPQQQPQGQPAAGMEQGPLTVAGPAQQPPAQTWSPGAKAGQRVTLLGFDTDKLMDPNSGSAAGSKYTPAAKAFAAGLGQDVGLSRGGLDNMVNYLKANGFENATSDGKQKIDFGDGNGLIDVIRSDGQIVFQNTTGNPTWEGKGYKPDAGGMGAPSLGSIGQMPQGLGSPLNAAPNPYMVAPPQAEPIPAPAAGPDYAAQLAQMAQQSSQRALGPQTVQGPQAMDIKSLMAKGVPGFVGGVEDFAGGPAIVGEKGPELVNLPAGSDVIPNGAINFGNGGGAPAIGTPGLNFGNGGGMPAIGTPGGSTPINFGGGGGDMPAIGQAGGGGAINFGGGGGMPGIGTPGGAGGGPGSFAVGASSSGGYNYNPMGQPQNYNPQNIAGPDRLTLGNISQSAPIRAQQVQAGYAQAGGPVSYDRVTGQTVAGPERIGFERVQGPEALQAQQLGPAQQQANLSAEQLQLDPSYQFRLKEGLGALQNSAAAKGMLHSPNVLRGLQDYGQNAASQEYAAANARNLGVQQQNFQNTATVAGANNAANAQAYGLSNQFQQQAALANQSAGLDSSKFNVTAAQQAAMFNAQQNQQAALANQSAGVQTGMFNSGQQTQNNQFNVGNQMQSQLANQGANLGADQFNANQNFQTQQANIGNQLAAYNAYQPLNQQNQQFNAAQQSAAAQNNFANQFSVNQANNAGSLGAFNANLGAELGRGGLDVSRGQLALGNRSADQSYALGQGNLALGNRSADQSYDLGLRNNALGYYGAQNSYNLGLGNLGLGQGQLDLSRQGQQYNQDANTFNTNYGVYRDNRDAAFNEDLARTQIGAGAAGNYGNQAGQYYTNQGAANGNAGMAGAGAWAGALGTIGNVAGQAGAYGSQYGNSGINGANVQGQPYTDAQGVTWNRGSQG